MDYSFYGGRKGAAFIITKRYASIQEMIDSFAQGSNYLEVNYDTYVIIDTENKNDPENGCVYKRGYNYIETKKDKPSAEDRPALSPQERELFNKELREYIASPGAGAEYVGQIVGPAGPAPSLEFKTQTEVNDIAKGHGLTATTGRHGIGNELVPGKTEIETAEGKIENKYEDEIHWSYCTIRDENFQDSTAYLGFKIPYLVVDYTAESTSPYYNREVTKEIVDEEHHHVYREYKHKDLIQRDTSGDLLTHPFFEKWDIKIPQGLKGESFNHLRVIPANESSKEYISTENLTPEEKQAYEVSLLNKTDSVTSKAEDRSILVYDYYNFDIDEQGDRKTFYLGDYNMIDDLKIEEDGTIHIKYTNQNDLYKQFYIKRIDNMNLTQNGKFDVIFNTKRDDKDHQKPDVYTTTLEWIDNVTLTPEGKLSFYFNTNDRMGTDPCFETRGCDGNMVQWIKSIELTEDLENHKDGTVVVTYNTPKDDGNGDYVYDDNHQLVYNETKFEQAIRWIDDISLDANGTLVVTYNTHKDGHPGYDNDTFHEAIHWVDGITIDEQGLITFEYNYHDEDDKKHTESLVQRMRWINTVSMNKEGVVTLHYNNDGSSEENPQGGKDVNLEEAIRWVNRIYVENADATGKEGSGDQRLHLIYNTETTYIDEHGIAVTAPKFETVGEPINYVMKTVIRPGDYHLLVYYSDPARRKALVKNHLSATYDDQEPNGLGLRNDWYDAGCVKSPNGILVGKNYTEADIKAALNVSNFTIDQIISFLNTEHPYGLGIGKNSPDLQNKILENADLIGKLASVGAENTPPIGPDGYELFETLNNPNKSDVLYRDKMLFAFDYEYKDSTKTTQKGWFYLGQMGLPSIVVGRVDDQQTLLKANSLPINSVWLVVEQKDKI